MKMCASDMTVIYSAIIVTSIAVGCAQLLRHAARESGQKAEAYWINTSRNDLIKKIIGMAEDGTEQMEIERLIAGESVVSRFPRR